jgi:hypothetical protein
MEPQQAVARTTPLRWQEAQAMMDKLLALLTHRDPAQVTDARAQLSIVRARLTAAPDNFANRNVVSDDMAMGLLQMEQQILRALLPRLQLQCESDALVPRDGNCQYTSIVLQLNAAASRF